MELPSDDPLGGTPMLPEDLLAAGSVGSRKVCESLVLDSPKTLLSKTPEQIADIAKQMRKGP